MSAALMLSAWAIEVIFGWPKFLYRIIRHPVVWLGALINLFEQQLNRPNWPRQIRYITGAFSTVFVVCAAVSAAHALGLATPDSTAGFIIDALVASSLIASRSLYEHVADVARPLAKGDVTTARNSPCKNSWPGPEHS